MRRGNSFAFGKVKLTLLLRGRRSRNKVSVGEPAEGSITRLNFQKLATYCGGLPLLCLTLFSILNPRQISKSFSQLLAMDVSARTTMKDAAKCDKRCEWQNSANQKKAERILRF